MTSPQVFDNEIVLPDDLLTAKQKTLLGFDARFAQVRDQLRLLLNIGGLDAWNRKHHRGALAICSLVSEQYPLIIFHGDVGTGKTATAECVANRLIAESGIDDCVLFRLSNRVRGSGKVGEMGTLLSDAFRLVGQAAGKGRRAVLLIDEGDSLTASRSQDHSHHEDRVAVNTVIQAVDNLRRFEGRVVVFLCTNRVSALDPALLRRAAIIEEFRRPSSEERRQLFALDLAALCLSAAQIAKLVSLTGKSAQQPDWTYSDIRTRLYPAALALAFPDRPLDFELIERVVSTMKPSPVIQDRQ